MHSQRRLSLGLPAWSGLPNSWLICQRALPPLTPEGSTNASVRCFFVDGRLQPFWKSGHLHSHNEAESGSLTLRLAPLLPGASAAGLLPPSPPSRLLAERTIRKVSAFSSPDQPSFAWRARKMWERKIESAQARFYFSLPHFFLSEPEQVTLAQRPGHRDTERQRR